MAGVFVDFAENKYLTWKPAARISNMWRPSRLHFTSSHCAAILFSVEARHIPVGHDHAPCSVPTINCGR